MPVSLTKQKKIHLSAVPTIPLQMLSRKERWAIPLSCVHHFVLITSEKTPCTWLSTSQMLTGHFPFHSESFFYCSFTNLLKWRLHYGKMVRIPGYSMAVRALYHSDGLVKSRLVDFKCFLSDQHTRLEIKKSKFSWTEIMYFAEMNTIQGRQCEVRMFLPVSISSIIDFLPCTVQLESQHSAAVVSNLGAPVSTCFYSHSVTQGRHTKN